MSNTLIQLEKAIGVFADSFREHKSEEIVKINFNRVVEAGRALYQDKECEVFTDAENVWQEEDRLYLMLFTSEKEITKDVKTFARCKPASKLFDFAAREDGYKGVVINPYGPNPFTFDDWALVAVIVDSFEVIQTER